MARLVRLGYRRIADSLWALLPDSLRAQGDSALSGSTSTARMIGYACVGVPINASVGNHDYCTADSPAAEFAYTWRSPTWRRANSCGSPGRWNAARRGGRAGFTENSVIVATLVPVLRADQMCTSLRTATRSSTSGRSMVEYIISRRDAVLDRHDGHSPALRDCDVRLRQRRRHRPTLTTTFVWADDRPLFSHTVRKRAHGL